MMTRWVVVLVLALPALGQNVGVMFAGERLQLGMNKDALLSRFAANPNVKVVKAPLTGTDSYFVSIQQLDKWKDAGGISFRAGKLDRISVTHFNENQSDAASLARAIYTAIAGDKPIDLWTGFNGDANRPLYEIHIVFNDREVVIRSASFDKNDIVSVETQFPRLRSTEQK